MRACLGWKCSGLGFARGSQTKKTTLLARACAEEPKVTTLIISNNTACVQRIIIVCRVFAYFCMYVCRSFGEIKRKEKRKPKIVVLCMYMYV